MRSVTTTPFVQAAIERASTKYQTFKLIFEEAVIWQLQRAALHDAVEIPGRDPRVFVLEVSAWRAEGLPVMSIGFSHTESGIEIVSLTLLDDSKPKVIL